MNQVTAWVRELQEQMRHRIEEQVLLQARHANPNNAVVGKVNTTSQLHEDYDQLGHFFAQGKDHPNSSLYVLE